MSVTSTNMKFQQLKPEMMAEAISNAAKTAKQFAENSRSAITYSLKD